MRDVTLTISLAGIVIGGFAGGAVFSGEGAAVVETRAAIMPEPNDVAGFGRAESVVVTQGDDEAIRGILERWRMHQQKVSYSSMTEPYFDCDAYGELLAYGWKAVPYLIEQLARQQAVEPYLGSALIDDPNVKTLDQVYEYNRLRKSRVHDETLAPWILTRVLWELTSPEVSQTSKRTAAIEPVDWFDWWHRHKSRFVFSAGGTPEVVIPRRMLSSRAHVATSVRNGLLDFCAVSATYRQMIERAAAETAVETFIGEHRYIDVIGSVRMKAVTYEEFLYMVGRDVYILGVEYRKTEDGYWVGGDKPAEPRAILDGWGIKMGRTAFGAGDDIPVTIVTRGMPQLEDADKEIFARCGSFCITRNDGSVVKEYEPAEGFCGAAPAANGLGAMHEVELLLNQFCKLGVGEYNVRFRYQGYETPSIAIEVYPSESKAARMLRGSRSTVGIDKSMKGKTK